MAGTIVANPVGIDYNIKKLQALLLANLWTSYTYNSHARAVMVDGIPHILKSGNDYTELLMDDTASAHSFFTESGERDFVRADYFLTNVDIHFFINLKTCYPTITDHIASEYAIRDIWQLLLGEPYGFRMLSVSQELEGMKYTDAMQPFHYIKVTCELDCQMFKSSC